MGVFLADVAARVGVGGGVLGPEGGAVVVALAVEVELQELVSGLLGGLAGFADGGGAVDIEGDAVQECGLAEQNSPAGLLAEGLSVTVRATQLISWTMRGAST
uniref:hypothetical protein n=1 Tax=Streptomyces laurentii TaxID=39478 RepID=UPI0015E8551A|nr:hypothetical protein [Streptomyces laurentii]